MITQKELDRVNDLQGLIKFMKRKCRDLKAKKNNKISNKFMLLGWVSGGMSPSYHIDDDAQQFHKLLPNLHDDLLILTIDRLEKEIASCEQSLAEYITKHKSEEG